LANSAFGQEYIKLEVARVYLPLDVTSMTMIIPGSGKKLTGLIATV